MKTFIRLLSAVLFLNATAYAAFIPPPGSIAGGTGMVTNGGTGNNNIFTNASVPVQNFGLDNISAAAVSGKGTNSEGRGIYGFSVNGVNTLFLQKKLNAGGKLTILNMGDSTGADPCVAEQAFFASNYVYGAEHVMGGNASPSAYFGDASSGNPGVVQTNASSTQYSTNWWGSMFQLTNGFDQTFGIRNFTPMLADRCQFYYIASSSYGTLRVYTSPSSASNTWTLQATIDTTAGTAGLKVTNLSLTLDSYYVKISNSVAGAASYSRFVWPYLRNTSSNNVGIFAGNLNGGRVEDFLGMGTHQIATFLTNIAPDLIIWQQTKSVASYDYFTNLASVFRTYMTNTDVALVLSQPSLDASVEADPANGQPFQLAKAREIALTNAWGFVDNFSPFFPTNYTGVPAQFYADQIHFTATGQKVSGQDTIKQLGLLQVLSASGLLRPVSLDGYAKLAGGNLFTGGGQTMSGGLLSVSNEIWAKGASASLNFERQTAGDSARIWFDGSGATATIKIDTAGDAYVNPLLYLTLPFGTPLKLDVDVDYGSPVIGSANPWQMLMTNALSKGTSTNQGTYLQATNIASSWPANATSQGAYALVNSNGTLLALTSLPGSTTWAATNQLAPTTATGNTNDIVVTTRYTNPTLRPAYVSASFTLTPAAAGTAEVVFSVELTGVVTNRLKATQGATATPSAITIPIGGVVPAGATYYFSTNLTGASVSATFVGNSFSFITW